MSNVLSTTINNNPKVVKGLMSQGLLGLCCLIETRDCIERITLTAVLFEKPLGHLLHRFPATDVNTSKISHAFNWASRLEQ